MYSHFKSPFFLLFFIPMLAGCATKPKGLFSTEKLPPAPDYGDLQNWAAHPMKTDSADLLPIPELDNVQDTSGVDVFFLHPTTYTRRPGNTLWNGPIEEDKLRTKTEKYPIRYQATALNGAGRIYAPFYRQAHIESYFTKNRKESAKQAFGIAYSDVERAFLYFLENENEGRPFIIASHSQGTQHAERLIMRLIDGKALQKKMIAAYLIGMPVTEDAFKEIRPCRSEIQTNCFCSWRTWKRGSLPIAKRDTVSNVLVTNPLTWKTTGYAPREMNKGTLLRDFHKIYKPGLVDAEVQDRVLWVNRPRFPWSFLILRPNYHIADYNLFWMNIRENARMRVQAYLNRERS